MPSIARRSLHRRSPARGASATLAVVLGFALAPTLAWANGHGGGGGGNDGDPSDPFCVKWALTDGGADDLGGLDGGASDLGGVDGAATDGATSDDGGSSAPSFADGGAPDMLRTTVDFRPGDVCIERVGSCSITGVGARGASPAGLGLLAVTGGALLLRRRRRAA